MGLTLDGVRGGGWGAWGQLYSLYYLLGGYYVQSGIVFIFYLCNFIPCYISIQCDRMIEARRPDTVLIHKKNKEVKIIDIALPGDTRVKEKELEKIKKYQLI